MKKEEQKKTKISLSLKKKKKKKKKKKNAPNFPNFNPFSFIFSPFRHHFSRLFSRIPQFWARPTPP
jgi:predicted RNA-binding protein with RPS1 domain